MTTLEAYGVSPDRVREIKAIARKKRYHWLRRGVAVPGDLRYVPQTPTLKQKAFLDLLCREAFYGGAAGGGKSSALLMAALQYVHIPNYAALILRRTYPQLTKPDSILDRAHSWLRDSDASYDANGHKFTFPSGAVLQFGYLQYDKDVYQYDGPAYQFIGYDELTQFTEWQYRFLFGRLRRPRGMPVPLRMRSASNPGGVGHLWAKDRFIKRIGARLFDRVFIPARLEDNPHLDISAYRGSLGELDPITRKQREEGDWEITPEGLIFRREWLTKFLDPVKVPRDLVSCRFWDLAASEKKGDYTVGALVSRSESTGLIYIQDIVRGRWGPGDVERHVKMTTAMDGPRVRSRMEQEPGASGKLVISQFAKLLIGYNFEGVRSTGSKTTRWMPLATACHNDLVRIVNGAWNEDFMAEMVNVPEAANDDQADGASGAYAEIALNPSIFVGVTRVRAKVPDQEAR